MSQTSSANADYPNFQSIFDDAVKAYDEKTKGNITENYLLGMLAPCKSANDVLTVLHQKENTLSTSINGTESIIKWLTPTIHVLCAFSAAIAQGVGLVSLSLFTSSESMASCMFSGIPASKCDLRWNWSPPLGQYMPFPLWICYCNA
jgi:hypothetical protein